MRGVVGKALERGIPSLAALEHVYSACVRVERLLRFSCRTRLLAIGGATVGGSGRTALALAAARLLVDRGARVAIVGHAYRARPGRARVVTTADALVEVGDEARMLARALGDRAAVVVAPKRQDALALAENLADVVILDGVLQTAPMRAGLSLLALREDAPWGSGRALPAGDLRAPREMLEAACDRVTHVRMPLALVHGCPPFAGARVGLVTAVARGDRVARAIAAAGADVVDHAAFPDHGPVDLREVDLRLRGDVDFWLCTAKCHEHLIEAGAPGLRRAPLFALDGAATLDESTKRALLTFAHM
jgi:tetraacyldisaccharide 4'-kinase